MKADAVEGSRRRARWQVAAAGGLTLAVLATVGVVASARRSAGGASGDGASAATDVASLPTSEVTRRDLEERTDLQGTLGYGEVTELSVTAPGTITALTPVGSVVDRGQTLVEVNGQPVPLLFGARPLWRPLAPGVDDGPDVQELEENLVALGIGDTSALTVDQHWTGATTGAVEDWQESLGRERTGSVAPGDVVFQPGPVRVAEHPTPVGAPAGGPVIGVTGTTRLVTVDLDATKQSLVATGQAVDIELPDGTATTGTVYSVGHVATSGDQGSGADAGASAATGDAASTATVEVVVALDDPAAGSNLDQAPVTVGLVTSAAQDVLAVPVEALLASAEGGYAVEEVHDDGTTRLVTVELGAFADGWVEVVGNLAEGDRVVVPE